jgi:Zn finger protein HypA/HybF involved in hydrogenase expression
MEKRKEKITCNDCTAEYIITYHVGDSIEYCPMCGADVFDEEYDDDFESNFIDDDYE